MFKRLASGLFGLVAFAAMGHASTFTFVGTASGGAVNVKADFTLSAGSLTLKLTNNTANIVDVGQALTDIFFNLGGLNLTGTTLTNVTGTQVVVAADGSTTPGSATPLNEWSLEYGVQGFTTDLHLTDLGNAQPKLAILGPDTAGKYSSANGSIAGNVTHNPFFDNFATFTITNSAITANTVISNVLFSFNTTAGDNHQGTCTIGCAPTVPEPITSSLVGTGLIGLFFLGRRRASKKA